MRHFLAVAIDCALLASVIWLAIKCGPVRGYCGSKPASLTRPESHGASSRGGR